MVRRQILLASVIVIALGVPCVARGADVDDLKTAFEQGVKALNAQDVDGFMALAHDQAVVFGAASPFPVDGKAAQRQTFQSAVNNRESTTFTPVNPQFRVIGDTGIAWGHAVITLKPKGGPLETQYVRYTLVYVKTDGKWLRAAGHVSWMPPGH